MTTDWPKNYVFELADLWVKKHGKGSARGVLIRNAFRHLRDAGAPWKEVLLAWDRYVKYEAPEWQQPHLFARKWRSWLQPPVTNVARKAALSLEVMHDAERLLAGDDAAGRALPE